MKTIPELRNLLITGYLRGGYRSAAYTVGGLVIAAWAILFYAPHLGWIGGALALVAVVWSVLMLDLGQKAFKQGTRMPLPLTLTVPATNSEPEEVA